MPFHITSLYISEVSWPVFKTFDVKIHYGVEMAAIGIGQLG